MKIVYDPDQDIVQISLAAGQVEETAQIAPGLVLDYDEDAQVIGLEIRGASQKITNPYAIAYCIGQANRDKPQPKSGQS